MGNDLQSLPIPRRDLSTDGAGAWYDANAYKPWGMRPQLYVCPADRSAAEFPLAGSYVMNYGDAVKGVGYPIDFRDRQAAMLVRATNRGAFGPTSYRFRDFLDGLSNTLMFSEACIADDPVARGVADLAFKPANVDAAIKDAATKYWPDGRKACWADGTLRSSGFQTILPPNSRSATSQENELEGILSASSHHVDGVHVALADGSVQFATNSIDHGDSTSPTVSVIGVGDGKQKFSPPGSRSQYGLWGALGTRASMERIDPSSELTDPPRELTAIEKQQFLSKPSQQWTAADGKRKIMARQIDVARGKYVVLMLESGDVRRVPLSDLASEDAFRAVEQHFAERKKAQQSLKAELEEGLKLLEDKQYAAFAERFVPGSELDAAGMGRMVERERGILIYKFDLCLRTLRLGGIRQAQFIQDDTGALIVEFPNAQDRPFISELELMYSNGKWHFAAPR